MTHRAATNAAARRRDKRAAKAADELEELLADVVANQTRTILASFTTTAQALTVARVAVFASGDDPTPPVRTEDLWDQKQWDDAMVEAETHIATFVTGELQTDFGIQLTTEQPFVQGVTARHVANIEDWSLDFKNLVSRIVDEGHRELKSVDQVAADLQAAGTKTRRQANTIARTEIVSASNTAQWSGVKTFASPGDTKTWDATADDRTRKDHKAAHGQTVPVEAPFIVGGEEGMHPGDRAFTSKQVANCRCTFRWNPATEPLVDTGIDPTKLGHIPLPLDDLNETGGNSATAHMVDGRFSPERQALHDEIVRQALQGIPRSQKPTFYMTGGGSAAGKGTVLRSGASTLVGKEGTYVHIDSDEIKKLLPETQAMMNSGDDSWAAFTHEESSYLAKRIMAAARENERDYLLDGTGDGRPESVLKKVREAKQAGYSVNATYVTIPVDEALKRSNERGQRSGRYVPERIIIGTHRGVSEVWPEVFREFDKAELIDNTDGQRMVARWSRGKLVVAEPDIYKDFLAKRDYRPMGSIPLPLDDLLEVGGNSATKHMIDGKFTPERQALHDEIVRRHLEGIEASRKPTFFMTGGGSGAGKGTVLRSGASKLVGKPGTYVHIDSDEIKQMLPETKAMIASGDETWAGFTHEESSYLAKRIMAASRQSGVDYLLDGTGDGKPSSVLSKVDEAKRNGYAVKATYVTIPIDEALKRAQERGERSGRFVPERIVIGTHRGVSEVWPEVYKKFDEAELIDNTDGQRTVARWDGKRLTVREKAMYADFLAKRDYQALGNIPIPLDDLIEQKQNSAMTHMVTKGPPGTTGRFTPERQALHDEIVRKHLEGIPPSRKPTFYMTGGGSAAGKGTVLRSGASKLVGKPGTYVHIDSDEIKKMLPETKKMMDAGDDSWAAFTHEESSYLAKRVMAASRETGVDYLLDGTGDGKPESVLKKVEEAKRSRYAVKATYVTIPIEEALKRSQERGERTGRFVPEKIIIGTHMGVSDVWPKVFKAFDEAELIDNTDGQKLVARWNGKRLTVRERGIYQSFLDKVNWVKPAVDKVIETVVMPTFRWSDDRVQFQKQVARTNRRPSWDNFVQDEEVTLQDWQKKLTDDEHDSIAWYTGPGYGLVQRELRNLKGDVSKIHPTLTDGQDDLTKRRTLAQRARALVDALAKHPIREEPVRVYRGMRSTRDFHAADAVKNLKAGDIVTLDQFMSTSVQPTVAESFADMTFDPDNPNVIENPSYKAGPPVVWEIATRQGANIRNISNVASEAEVLLNVGTKLRVVEPMDPKTFRIKFEEVLATSD